MIIGHFSKVDFSVGQLFYTQPIKISIRYKNSAHFRIFHIFGLGLASSNEKWHLTSPLPSSYLYQTPCQNIKVFLKIQELCSCSVTDNGRTDGRTDRSIIGHAPKIDLTIGRSVDFSAGRAMIFGKYYIHIGKSICLGVARINQ